MMGLPASTRVRFAAGHTDMKKGFDCLSAFYRDNRFNLLNIHATLGSRMTFGNKVID